MGQDDPNKPSTHILIDGRRRSWMSDGGNMLSTGARWSRRVARDCCRPRDRRAPPSRRHTDHDRPEWTSPVPSGTSVVDARHPPPQPTIEPSCLAFVRAKKFRYRLGVNRTPAPSSISGHHRCTCTRKHVQNLCVVHLPRHGASDAAHRRRQRLHAQALSLSCCSLRGVYGGG